MAVALQTDWSRGPPNVSVSLLSVIHQELNVFGTTRVDKPKHMTTLEKMAKVGRKCHTNASQDV